MQIKELTLPPNQKKITYEICKNGKTNIYTTSQSSGKKTYLTGKDLPKIHLGQLNSIQMTQGNQLQNILEKNPFESVQKKTVTKREQSREICCSCKKSKCLKMYCECFAKRLFCTNQCACLNCTNTKINAKKLQFLREEVVVKKQVESKGCRCQKSGCNKKYCQCFGRQQKCGVSCQCLNCQNGEENDVKTRKPKAESHV